MPSQWTSGPSSTRFRSRPLAAAHGPSGSPVFSMAAAALWLRPSLCPAARGLRTFSSVARPAARTAGPRVLSRSERPRRRKALPPRTEKMDADQDWPSVYPVAAPFKPSAVPLPVRMGYPMQKDVPMAKEGNLELLKIPNFLHLTPVAIKRHCEALKGFCTEWPAALDSDEKCEQHFPLEVETADYVSSGPSVRNPKARVVTLRVKLSSLNLDKHAKEKLIKLVGERYCKATDVLTLSTDRCPLKRQNHDYALYLLTVLYHESWKTEEWEKNKCEEDKTEYKWERSPSERSLVQTLLQMRASEGGEAPSREELLRSAEAQEYRRCVLRLKKEGETQASLAQYKEAVRRLLDLA